MNLYQGMNMNPVNYVDPWGEVEGKFSLLPHEYSYRGLLADQYLSMGIVKRRIYKPLTSFVDPYGKTPSVDDVISYKILKNGSRIKVSFNFNINLHVYFEKGRFGDIAHENRHVKDISDAYKRIRKHLEKIEAMDFEFDNFSNIQKEMDNVRLQVKQKLERANKRSAFLLDCPLLSLFTECFRIIKDELVSWFVNDDEIFLLQNKLAEIQRGGNNGI